jgi:hypothetical protein
MTNRSPDPRKCIAPALFLSMIGGRKPEEDVDHVEIMVTFDTLMNMIDEGLCPRCGEEVGEHPAMSHVTGGTGRRCIPICARCGLHETRSSWPYLPDLWPIDPAEIEATFRGEKIVSSEGVTDVTTGHELLNMEAILSVGDPDESDDLLARSRELSRLATAFVTASRAGIDVPWREWVAELGDLDPEEQEYLDNRIAESMEWSPEELEANTAEIDEFFRTGVIKPEDDEGGDQ